MRDAGSGTSSSENIGRADNKNAISPKQDLTEAPQAPPQGTAATWPQVITEGNQKYSTGGDVPLTAHILIEMLPTNGTESFPPHAGSPPDPHAAEESDEVHVPVGDDAALHALCVAAAAVNPTFAYSSLFFGFEDSSVEDAYQASLTETRCARSLLFVTGVNIYATQ